MKIVLTTLALLAVAAPAAADWRDRGPGIAGVRDGAGYSYAISDFDAVELGIGGTMDVRLGDRFMVRAEGPAAAFANLHVEREGNRLKVLRRYEQRDDHDLERQLHFHVVVPRLSGAGVGGSGHLSVAPLSGAAFSGSVGGSGSLALAGLDVRKAVLSVGGSGDIGAAGHADTLTAEIGGSGKIVAPGLRASNATVSIGGSGSVRARVDGPARVSIAGSGDVDLGPGARCSTSRVGSGTVRCGR